MIIQVILAGPLKKYNGGTSQLKLMAEEGWTVADVIRKLGIPDGSFSFVSIAGRKVSDNEKLRDHDQVKIFPPVSGG